MGCERDVTLLLRQRRAKFATRQTTDQRPHVMMAHGVALLLRSKLRAQTWKQHQHAAARSVKQVQYSQKSQAIADLNSAETSHRPETDSGNGNNWPMKPTGANGRTANRSMQVGLQLTLLLAALLALAVGQVRTVGECRIIIVDRQQERESNRVARKTRLVFSTGQRLIILAPIKQVR